MIEPMVNRINAEPASLLGLGDTEFRYLSYVVGSLSLLVMLLVGVYLSFLAAPPAGLLFFAGVGYMSAGVLRGLKRNRPDRYYIHATWLKVASWLPFITGRVVVRSGAWSLGRNEMALMTRTRVLRRRAREGEV